MRPGKSTLGAVCPWIFACLLHHTWATFSANYFYLGTLTSIPLDLPYRTPDVTATVSTLAFENSGFSGLTTPFAAQFATILTITTAGSYAFELDFRDGARLKFSGINVDDPPIIEVDGTIDGTSAHVRTSSPAQFAAGSYALYVEYFNTGSGNARLKLRYRGPDTSEAWATVCETSSRCSTLSPLQAPQMTLFGDIPYYLLKNTSATYEDPGSQCYGSQQFWDVVLEKPSLAETGIFTANYSCRDSYGLTATATREVQVRDEPSIVLLGPSPFRIMLGDTFQDPEACCLDFEGKSLTWVGYGSVSSSTAGLYKMSYTCVDPLINSVVTTERPIVVNNAPSMYLLGDSTVKITKGTGYTDAGVVCQDAEDGLILNLKPDSEEILAPVRVFTSEALAASKSRPAVDGNGNSACGNCQTVASGHLKWVRLDLGMARTVTQVRLYNPQQGWNVHVGSTPWPVQGATYLYEATTGTCSSVSKWEIWDLELCQRAADFLGLEVTSAAYDATTGGLHACAYDSSAKSLKIRLGDARTAASYAGTLSSVSAVAAATLSGTQSRICGPLAPFTKVDTGFCEDYGYQAIRTSVHCGLAAQSLGITLAAHSSSASAVAPGGCYYFTTDSSVRLNQAQSAMGNVAASTLQLLCQLPGSCYEFYVTYDDANMIGTSSTSDTWGECMSSCAASSTCGVWTYDISSKACKIFTAGSAGKASTDANLMSGPPFCNDMPGAVCLSDVAAATGWSNATCQSPLAGRFVDIWTREASSSMSVCEVEVWGGLAPKMPTTFQIDAGCTGASISGSFILNADLNGYPAYHYPQESVYAASTGLETATFAYESELERWTLSTTNGNISYAYTASTLPEAALIVPAELSSFTCPHPRIRGDPATSCSWRFGFLQKESKYECQDGTLCDNDCCSSRGGLYRCPYNLPMMCETATSGAYTCATDCAATGGPRLCQATDSSATTCFASGVNGKSYTTTMTVMDATSAEDCQNHCKRMGGCAYFSYYPTLTTSNCKLHDSMAVQTTEAGTTSGPATCLASIATINNVNPDQIGFFRVYYQCSDAMGSSVGGLRTVEVGCEGPNPTGIYGGNVVTCEVVQSGPAETEDYLACLKICTADTVCETYEWLGFTDASGGNCTTYSSCDGKYSSDLNNNRYVGYCQRINHFPKIFVIASDRTVNVGNTYAEGAVYCTDYEDPYPPDPTTVTSFDVNVPGQYMFYYTCTDTIGQQTHGNRTVTVKANCTVPSGIANAADPPCTEGSGPFEHGQTCTPVCEAGYTRSRNLLTCTTASDADYASDWDPTTFICGDSPCDKPYVQSNLKDDGDLSCQEGEIVPSGATCTPNCKEGTDPKYVAVDTSSGATIASLACDRGTFTPLTYYCHSAASLPQYVAYKSRDVDAVVVNWAVGNPSDCVFSNWRMQYILTASATATAWSDWQENPNCDTTTLSSSARTDILECTANTLEEGSTYKFRVREECTNSDLNGDWQTSAEITTLSLTPPVTIFTLPNADVYGSPGSIMVAFDQAIKPGYSYRKIDVIKSGENCLPSADGTYNFSRYASVISTTSLGTEAGIEIAGSRIVIIKPDTAYWAGSCTYNISFEQASILPDTTGTIKELVAFWYNFTYIEIPPALSYITRNDSAITSTSVQYNILWDKRTQMNCTASPKDAAVCAEKAQTAVLSPTSDLRCLPHNSTNDLIQELDVVLSFTIEGLYPGVEYFVVCAGWIPGQFWVPTVDIEDHWGTQQTFTTLTDTETGIASFQLTVYAVCSDGSIKQIYTSAMRTSEFELGYTAQIDHWIAACQPGISLQLSESVDFIYQGDIVTASANAYVQWDAGPNITVTYTKPADATESAIVTAYLKFTVLALAWWEEQLSSNMAAHQVLGQIVDIGFSYPLFSDSEVPGYPANADVSASYMILSGGSSLPPLHNSTGVALPTGYEELVLDVGAKLNFNIKVSQTSFDWNDVSLFLKSVTTGYLIPHSEVSIQNQVVTWELAMNGQGTQLPFILRWRSALFVIPIWISFSPPAMSVIPLQASINSQFVVEATFTNVPAWGIEGFALPADIIQLYVHKNGYWYNLCGATTFSATWDTGSCPLRPAALTDIIIRLQVLNHQTSALTFVQGDQESGLANIITYAQPLPQAMAAAVENAVYGETEVLDLGMMINEHPARIYIQGNTFPSINSLDMKGAAIPGYKAELVSPTGWQACEPVELCSSITWKNASYLECLTNPCLDITCLPRQPNVKLYLGDLVGNTELQQKIVFPRPIVQSYTPRSLEDVGLNRVLEFSGLYFSEESCQSTHTESIQFVSNATSTVITLGEFAAPCSLQEHNSTYIRCVINDRVRNVRDQSDTTSLVPPVLLSSTQTLAWTLRADWKPINGDDSAGLFASEVDFATGARYNVPALEFTVTLRPCDAGQRRIGDYSYECRPCSPGRWVTTAEAEWPLRCNPCARGTYQNSEGAVNCKACPSNTVSPEAASDIQDCTCLPGYYSSYYNETTGSTVPGTTCIGCHDTELMQLPDSDEFCGDNGFTVGDLCTAEEEDLCVNVATTSVDLRICKTYCPGGTVWPRAKRTFWHLRRTSIDSQITGLEAFKPTMQRCTPKTACRPGNVCSKEYKSSACSECVFGYFKNAGTGLCDACGEAQVIGMIIMAIFSVIGSFGCLVFFAFFMRFNADIVFKRDILKAVQTYVVAPLKKSNVFAKAKKKSELRKAITIHKQELGLSYSYSKYKELGMVFRVDESNVVHLAGLMPDSPVRGKALVGWKLTTINGRRLKVRKEAEVQEWISRCRFPLRLTFSAPRKSKEQEKQEMEGRSAEGVNFDDDRKMIVVMLGVLTSFTKVSGFDFKWPAMFTELVKIAQMFSFNLNFFAPECSAETPYINKWLGFLVIPYFMIMPLTAAYIMALMATLPSLGPEAFQTKKALLTNAWARCICMVLLALLPFHLDTILIPFACINAGDGIYVLSDVPSVFCSANDSTFMTMFSVGSFAMLVFSSGFSWLVYCIWCSYQWQQGSRHRGMIPFYVAMVEVSTFGQRGYSAEVRARVMENVCAVRSFDVSADKLEEREALTRARDMLGGRADGRAQDEKQKESELGQDGLQQRLAITKAKKKFLQKKTWPTKADGNLLTYGWIFLVNTMLRNLLSNAAIKLTSNNLVVIGAGCQMLIFAVNVTMLVCLRPYKSQMVVQTETILMTVLFMVLWCAVMKELLEQHQDAYLYTTMIERVNTVITGLAFSLMFTVPCVPAYQVYRVVKKAAQLITGPDAILNEIYMTAHMRKVARRKEAEMAALNKLADKEVDTDEKREMLASVGLIMPHLDSTLQRFEEAGLGKYVLPDVQKRYMLRLGKLTAKINRERVLKRELEEAGLEAQRYREEAERAAAAHAALFQQNASEEEIEEARRAAEAAEVFAMQAENRLTQVRKTRQTRMTEYTQANAIIEEVQKQESLRQTRRTMRQTLAVRQMSSMEEVDEEEQEEQLDEKENFEESSEEKQFEEMEKGETRV